MVVPPQLPVTLLLGYSCYLLAMVQWHGTEEQKAHYLPLLSSEMVALPFSKDKRFSVGTDGISMM